MTSRLVDGMVRWSYPLPSKQPSLVQEPPRATDDAGAKASGEAEQSNDPVELFFDNAADAFCQAADHLVKPFHDLEVNIGDPLKVNLPTFFNSFLEHGNQFASECSLAFATFLRYSTLVDSVRATTTKQLATEIRGETFDEVDEVHRQYKEELATLSVELNQATRQLEPVVNFEG